jgi:hypothetical protein
MAIKIETEVIVRSVEDEPGTGFFQMTTEEGGVEHQDRVPAIYIEGGYKAKQAYIQEQFETGVPVVAYRAEERGMCVVVVNRDIVSVDTARKFEKQSMSPTWTWKGLEIGADYYSPLHVDSYGQGENTPKLEFTGTNRQTRAPIKITVGFVRP